MAPTSAPIAAEPAPQPTSAPTPTEPAVVPMRRAPAPAGSNFGGCEGSIRREHNKLCDSAKPHGSGKTGEPCTIFRLQGGKCPDPAGGRTQSALVVGHAAANFC